MVRELKENIKEFIFCFLDKGLIQTNEDNVLYKEIILRQHSVPLSDLMKIHESENF